MISNFDRQSIDTVISPAISTVCFYGLEHPEHTAALREQLLRLVNSTEHTGLDEQIPNDLPTYIKLALTDISAYLYSTYPIGDFFLVGELPPSLNEIQNYIRNMLQSIIFYLDDNPNSQASNVYKNIDSSVKKILHPDNIKAKKNIQWQDALLHAHKALNEEQNITVYRQITKPVNHLLAIKNHSRNKANDPIRIALDQRLFLLELLADIQPNHYQSTGPGTRRNEANELNNPQNFAAAENVVLPAEAIAPKILYFILRNLALFGSVGLILAFDHYAKQSAYAPRWPAGMTNLANSTAHLEQRGTAIPFDNMHHVSLPFTLRRKDNYPLLTLTSFNIQKGRDYANHENLSFALEKILERTHVDLLRKDVKFMDTYVTLWAFFAEHGRNVTHLAANGFTIFLDQRQANDLRALEALRVGLEGLLKEKYPEYHARLSCNNHQNPTEQVGTLNDLIKLEYESQHSLYRERIILFDNWLEIVKKYGIEYPSFSRGPSYRNDKIKHSQTPIAVINGMREVMEDKNCPWWQAPLGYVKKTAGDIQKILCTAWQNTIPILQKNQYARKYDDDEFYKKNPR